MWPCCQAKTRFSPWQPSPAWCAPPHRLALRCSAPASPRPLPVAAAEVGEAGVMAVSSSMRLARRRLMGSRSSRSRHLSQAVAPAWSRPPAALIRSWWPCRWMRTRNWCLVGWASIQPCCSSSPPATTTSWSGWFAPAWRRKKCWSKPGSSWQLLVPVAAADEVVAAVMGPPLTVSTALERCRPQA